MRFILGVVLGAALGVSLGLLVAPRAGSQIRQALQRRVRHGAEEPEGAEQAV